MTTWTKCPSVSYGGKPYFYVKFTEKGKITVIWSRLEEQWLTIGDIQTVKQSEAIYGLFPTSNKAIKYADSLA